MRSFSRRFNSVRDVTLPRADGTCNNLFSCNSNNSSDCMYPTEEDKKAGLAGQPTSKSMHVSNDGVALAERHPTAPTTTRQQRTDTIVAQAKLLQSCHATDGLGHTRTAIFDHLQCHVCVNRPHTHTQTHAEKRGMKHESHPATTLWYNAHCTLHKCLSDWEQHAPVPA